MVLPHTFMAIDLYYKWYENSDDRSLKALKRFQEGYFITLFPSPTPLFMLLRILSFRFQPLICPSCLFAAWATSPLGRPGRPSLNVPKASPYCALNHQPAPLSPSLRTSNSPSRQVGVILESMILHSTPIPSANLMRRYERPDHFSPLHQPPKQTIIVSSQNDCGTS